MKLLRLANTLNPTSAPYNQFSLGFKSTIDQTYCSLLKDDLSTEDDIKVFHGDGSILKMIKIVRGLIASHNFDVIHIHSGVMGAILFIAIFPTRISILKNTVFTLHNSWNNIKTRNQILNLIVMLGVRTICTCGKSSKESIPKIINFFTGHKTKAVVNGFDHLRIDTVEKQKNSNEHFNKNSNLKILCVGALNNTKNQLALIEVLREIKINAEVIFLGDGVNKKTLINFSKAINSCTKIFFKGRISRNLTIEHMLEADVSISLSKGEGLPIAVLESMYAGCFQILSIIPPHKEIAPPSSRCIFVDVSKYEDIASSLHFVEENIYKIRAERETSRKYTMDNFGLDNMLNEYMEVYLSFLNHRNSS